jgi:hypothetical protein
MPKQTQLAPAWTATDWAIFDEPCFAARMTAMRAQVTPKLIAWGEALAEPLAQHFGCPFFPHVARHLRRTTHPPAETWVAFGPHARGYKRDPILALTVGRTGLQARLMLKHEALELRVQLPHVLGEALAALRTACGRHPLRDFSDWDAATQAAPALELAHQAAWDELLLRATRKTRTFDLGFAIPPATTSTMTARRWVATFSRLLPLYAPLLAASG